MIPKKRKSKQRKFENVLPSKTSSQISLQAIMCCQYITTQTIITFCNSNCISYHGGGEGGTSIMVLFFS